MKLAVMARGADDNCVDWETRSFPAAASPGGPRPPQLDPARVHVEEEEPQVFQERHLRYAANDVNRSREYRYPGPDQP